MANEYATLDELKGARRRGDTASDVDLQLALTRASRAIDDKTGRRFWLDPAASARTFRPAERQAYTRDGVQLLVDDIGSTQDLVVEVGSGSTWSPITDYEPQPENALARGEAITGLLRRISWACGPITRVRVTARWGWPAVPVPIGEATLLLANRRYMRRNSPEGVLGSNEFGTVRVSRWDSDVEELISPYMLPGFGGG